MMNHPEKMIPVRTPEQTQPEQRSGLKVHRGLQCLRLGPNHGARLALAANVDQRDLDGHLFRGKREQCAFLPTDDAPEHIVMTHYVAQRGLQGRGVESGLTPKEKRL